MSKENNTHVCNDHEQKMTKIIPQILAEALAKSPKADACVEGHGIPNCAPTSKIYKGATASI